MAKNKVKHKKSHTNNKNYIIAQHKALARLKTLTNNNVPEIYACFAKVLIDEGKDAECVSDLFLRTQNMWNEVAETDTIKDMITWCEETTGIKLATED